MALETWLIDKSAYARLAVSPDREVWMERLSRGLVRISSLTMLELGYSFQNSSQAHYELAEPPLALMPLEYLGPRAEQRALDMQRALLEVSEHRGVSIPDLLIAASAEIAHHTLLHVDRDFELIARHSGQPIERLTTSGG
ncbi:MAG: Ribonuclease VapC2 [Cellulomonadaceae bacterium TMED98]|nr:MAG: Ribonuclease VapC2 [Cellulomonadaceae bacterium TMED98]